MFLIPRDTTEIPPQHCPNCGELFEYASALDHTNLPKPGCLVVCGYCASVGVFADDLSIRVPTAEEMVEFAADPELQAVVNHFRKAPIVGTVDLRRDRRPQ